MTAAANRDAQDPGGLSYARRQALLRVDPEEAQALEQASTPARLFFTGLMPSASFGVEVDGIPPAMLAAMRRRARKVQDGGGPGQRAALVSLLQKGPDPNKP